MFGSLVRAIICQQISGKVAKSILKRFVELFGSDAGCLCETPWEVGDEEAEYTFPSPERVLALGEDELRSAGVSSRKVCLSLFFFDFQSHTCH